MDFIASDRVRSRLHKSQAIAKTAMQPVSENAYEIQSIPVFASLKRYPIRRRAAKCTFDGFHEPEFVDGRHFAWTQSECMIRCRFYDITSIRYLWLEIANTPPGGTHIDLSADGQLLVKQRRVRGRSTVRAVLPSLRPVTSLDLTISCNTFVPSEHDPNSQDHRILGIAVRGITFAKRRFRYASGMYFKKPASERFRRIWDSLTRKAA